jgi:hypothetical protein
MFLNVLTSIEKRGDLRDPQPACDCQDGGRGTLQAQHVPAPPGEEVA